jgi:hydroxyethylthiazole kinase-like uncharacterized protein yjeF
VIPVLTPDEMSGVDRKAVEPVEELIQRAGFAVARAALQMLEGGYGRRVTVIAGPGNNGGDGRAAARFLSQRGARVQVVEAAGLSGGERLGKVDLVVDAAYGTGLSRPYDPPDPGRALVLAIDIPSGLSGLTGLAVGPGAVRADRTVTFAAYKPGLLLGDGPDHAGEIEVADIGLGPLVDEAASAWLVTDADVVRMWPERGRHAHKWQSAVEVVAGSAGMYGAPLSVTRGALRAGAGYVRLGIPGAPPGGGLPPGEQVGFELPAHGWDGEAAAGVERAHALVVGPGLGTADAVGPASSVAKLLGAAAVPAVVDADGLRALGDLDSATAILESRPAATVLTPHEGEYARLAGHPPEADRLADVRAVAARTGAVVLLKGSPTIVAGPDGRALLVNSGSARLATAGTGDVLSGVIGALLARGLPALEAAALGAHCHGRAAARGRPEGLLALDLPDLVADWLSDALH